MPAESTSQTFPQKVIAQAKALIQQKKQDRTTGEIEHPEYIHLASDCKIVKNSLEALSKQMLQNEKHWSMMCENQKNFGDCYAKLFHDNAELRHISAQWKETSYAIDADIRAHFEKQDSPHKTLKKHVATRIDELAKVLARRSELRRMQRNRNKLRKELDKLKADKPALDGATPEVAEKQRALHDAEKLYNETLAAVIATMKKLLAGANYTYACAFSEFCWVSTHASNIVEYSMRKMRDTANEAVKNMVKTLPPPIEVEQEKENFYRPVNDEPGDATAPIPLK